MHSSYLSNRIHFKSKWLSRQVTGSVTPWKDMLWLGLDKVCWWKKCTAGLLILSLIMVLKFLSNYISPPQQTGPPPSTDKSNVGHQKVKSALASGWQRHRDVPHVTSAHEFSAAHNGDNEVTTPLQGSLPRSRSLDAMSHLRTKFLDDEVN